MGNIAPLVQTMVKKRAVKQILSEIIYNTFQLLHEG